MGGRERQREGEGESNSLSLVKKEMDTGFNDSAKTDHSFGTSFKIKINILSP